MRRKQQGAPGPRGWALWQSVRRLRRDALEEYLALRKQFGDVVRLPMLARPLYLLSHPDAVQHVLRDQAGNYRKGILFKPIAALQGQGLLTSEDGVWRRQRRLAQPAFHARQLTALSDIMREEVQAVVHAWRQAAQTGQPVNVAAWMHRLTFRVVGRAVLGIAPDALDALGGQLQALGGQLLPYLAARSAYMWALPAWFPSPGRQRFRRAVAAYNAIVQQVIEARRRAMQHSEAAQRDVLAVLIAAHDDPAGEGMTDQQLRDEVITFIGAGAETSAHALSWTWYLLDRHPQAAQQLQAELDAVLGGRASIPADLSALPYGRMVLDEALRLYPPSAVLPRQANAPDVIGGYAVPKDAVVVMSQYVIHRHPAFWSSPEQFQPERFSPEHDAPRHRFAYLPFGAGPRGCIGKPFALMEMHLALATMAQTYTLRLAPQHTVVPELTATLRPRGGLWMTVHTR